MQTNNKLDKYSKFVAFSNYTNLTNQFNTRISFRIMSDNSSDITTLEDIIYKALVKKFIVIYLIYL